MVTLCRCRQSGSFQVHTEMDLTPKHLCTGCTACYAACPASAITMQEDDEGFAYPVVDAGNCTACGLCVKVCPVLHCPQPREPLDVYVAKAVKDDYRSRSSSGGIFPLLASEVLAGSGVVYGAGWERPSLRVIHKMVRNCEELEDLRGSKYVQSDLRKTFAEVRDNLKSGRPVLFTGCPCQVAGLKCFLGCEYENLICVDVICHSVGSPKVFESFKNQVSRGRKLTHIDFRSKVHSWKTMVFRAVYENGQEECVPFVQTLYAKGWFAGWFVRPCCFSCCFKRFRSQSDLSICDAWGIENIAPFLDDGKGVSGIFVLTAKGRRWLKTDQLCFVKVALHDLVKNNPCIIAPMVKTRFFSWRKRARFFKQFNHGLRGEALAMRRVVTRPLIFRVASWAIRRISRK